MPALKLMSSDDTSSFPWCLGSSSPIPALIFSTHCHRSRMKTPGTLAPGHPSIRHTQILRADLRCRPAGEQDHHVIAVRTAVALTPQRTQQQFLCRPPLADLAAASQMYLVANLLLVGSLGLPENHFQRAAASNHAGGHPCSRNCSLSPSTDPAPTATQVLASPLTLVLVSPCNLDTSVTSSGNACTDRTACSFSHPLQPPSPQLPSPQRPRKHFARGKRLDNMETGSRWGTARATRNARPCDRAKSGTHALAGYRVINLASCDFDCRTHAHAGYRLPANQHSTTNTSQPISTQRVMPRPSVVLPGRSNPPQPQRPAARPDNPRGRTLPPLHVAGRRPGRSAPPHLRTHVLIRPRAASPLRAVGLAEVDVDDPRNGATLSFQVDLSPLTTTARRLVQRPCSNSVRRLSASAHHCHPPQHHPSHARPDHVRRKVPPREARAQQTGAEERGANRLQPGRVPELEELQRAGNQQHAHRDPCRQFPSGDDEERHGPRLYGNHRDRQSAGGLGHTSL